MNETRKQLESAYTKIMNDLGIVKSKGIGQHVKEYRAKHDVSAKRARAIVIDTKKQLDAAKSDAYVKLMKHDDTVLTDQVFTKSACLRLSSRKILEIDKLAPKKKTAKKTVVNPKVKKAVKKVSKTAAKKTAKS